MRQNHRSPLKLSLLTCAIAAAAASASPVALAIDLCAGNSAITVSTAHPADNCTMNQTGATLAVTATGSLGLGIDINGDGVIISNAGTVSGAQTALHYLGSHSIVGLTNSGTVSVAGGTQANGLLSNGTVDLAGQLLNTGRIEVAASTATAGALAQGVSIADNVAGVLDNRGHITVDATGSHALAFGIHITHDVTGSLLNSGTVAVTGHDTGSGNAIAYGMQLLGLSGTGNLGNSGTLSATAEAVTRAQAYGLDASTLAGSATLANSGTLTASATAGSGSATAFGLHLGTLAGNAAVTNSGSITTLASAPSGDAAGLGIQAGTLSNSASLGNSGTLAVSVVGAATSVAAYGFSVAALNDTARLANSGKINVSVSNDSGYAYGVAMYQGGRPERQQRCREQRHDHRGFQRVERQCQRHLGRWHRGHGRRRRQLRAGPGHGDGQLGMGLRVWRLCPDGERPAHERRPDRYFRHGTRRRIRGRHVDVHGQWRQLSQQR